MAHGGGPSCKLLAAPDLVSRVIQHAHLRDLSARCLERQRRPREAEERAVYVHRGAVEERSEVHVDVALVRPGAELMLDPLPLIRVRALRPLEPHELRHQRVEAQRAQVRALIEALPVHPRVHPDDHRAAAHPHPRAGAVARLRQHMSRARDVGVRVRGERLHAHERAAAPALEDALERARVRDARAGAPALRRARVARLELRVLHQVRHRQRRVCADGDLQLRGGGEG